MRKHVYIIFNFLNTYIFRKTHCRVIKRTFVLIRTRISTIWMNCQTIIIIVPVTCCHLINKTFCFPTGVYIAGCLFCTSAFSIDFVNLCRHIFHCFRNIHKSVSVNFICHIDLLTLIRNFTMCSVTKVNGSVSVINRYFFIICTCIFETIHNLPFMIVSLSVSAYPYFNASFLNSFKVPNQCLSIFSCHRIRVCITHVTNLICCSVTDRCCLIPVIFFHRILFCKACHSTFYIRLFSSTFNL